MQQRNTADKPIANHTTDHCSIAIYISSRWM